MNEQMKSPCSHSPFKYWYPVSLELDQKCLQNVNVVVFLRNFKRLSFWKRCKVHAFRPFCDVARASVATLTSTAIRKTH